MSIPLIATHPYPYAGRSLQTGDAFEASERDAYLLKLIGRAVDAPKPERPSRFIQTRDLEPAGTNCPAGPKGVQGVAGISADESDDTSPKRRQYRRRDLTAED